MYIYFIFFLTFLGVPGSDAFTKINLPHHDVIERCVGQAAEFGVCVLQKKMKKKKKLKELEKKNKKKNHKK